MESAYQFNPAEHAENYRQKYQNIVRPDLLEHNLKAILAPKTAYPASAFLTSLIFYQLTQVDMMDQRKRFIGHSGGFSWIGASVIKGDVRTDDLQKMFRETTEFGFLAASLYLHIDFYDKNHRHLGQFDGGGLGVTGGGGGTGQWGDMPKME